MTKGKEPPRGWVFTGKNLCDNIKEEGVLNHFYYEPDTNSIYQIKNLRIKANSYLEVNVTFVNPENPARSKIVNVYGSRQRRANFNLINIIKDKELRMK